MMMDCIQGMRVTMGSLGTCPRLLINDGLMADIASGEALDDEEGEGSMDADDGSSSALTTGPVSGQYL